MERIDPGLDARTSNYLKRNKRLQLLAWVFTAVPLAMFVWFSVLAAKQISKYAALVDKSNQLQTKVNEQESKLKEQAQSLAVKQEAINIVKEQSPGGRPKVVIYRSTIAPQVKAALGELGYDVELSSYAGNPALGNKAVDTLEYGCAVRNEDIRTIAAALTRAGLPVRRIAPAMLKKDPLLIQLIASAHTDSQAPAMSASQISSWNRPDQPCASPAITPGPSAGPQ